MRSEIYIPMEALVRMRLEAEAAFPAECCGLLIGTSDAVTSVDEIVATQNQALEPNRFLIEPQTQFDWMRKLRGTDRRIIGHYHSHPNGRAHPSEYDAEMANETGQVWLIIPVEDGIAGEVQAFVSQTGTQKFRSIPIRSKG